MGATMSGRRSEPSSPGDHDIHEMRCLLLKQCSIPIPPDPSGVAELIAIYGLSEHISQHLHIMESDPDPAAPTGSEKVDKEETASHNIGPEALSNSVGGPEARTNELQTLKSIEIALGKTTSKHITLEANGLVISMLFMLVLSIVREETTNFLKCASANASYINETCGNIVLPSCPVQSAVISGQEDVILGVLGLIGLSSTLVFLSLLLWRNFSMTIFLRVLYNLHIGAVLLLVLLVVVFNAASSIVPWDLLWICWHVSLLSLFLL